MMSGTVSLLNWCVSNKRKWGIDWQDLQDSMVLGSSNSQDEQGRSDALLLREDQLSRAHAAFLFWKQRCKTRWDALGESHSRLLFRSVQARKHQNKIMSLKDKDNCWVTGQI